MAKIILVDLHVCGVVLVSAAVPMFGSNSSHSQKSLSICLKLPHLCITGGDRFCWSCASLRITCTYNRYCVMFISCPVYFITCNYIQKLYYVVITIIYAGTSPVSVTDLSQSLHHFKVLPQGCDRERFTGLPFRFTIQ